MTISVRRPLSAQSEVVNTNRRWNQDWYTWLGDLTDTIGTIDTSGGGGTDLGIINVKDFGADGRDRLYTNIVGGSGYTGGSASNLTAHPEDATAWTPNNVTVTANAINDPSGNLLADAVVETAANARHSIFDAASSAFTAGKTLRYVVEIKPGLRTWCYIALLDIFGDALFSVFNLTGAGVVGSTFAFGGAGIALTSTPRIEALANDWYRCTIEGTLGGTTVQPIINPLLGELFVWDNATDVNQIYAGNTSAPALYLGLSQIFAIDTYKGSVFLAGDGIFSGVPLTGGSGTNARANIVVGLGQVLNVTSYCPGSGYAIGDILSCAAADIGGTGSGFTCTVQTIGNDTVAIQTAMDSGNGNPVTVFFPPGAYNTFPQDARGNDCLVLRHSNIRMIGAGRAQSKIQCFVSGGRHPETSYDLPTVGGFTGIVWRGSAFRGVRYLENVSWEKLRITGMCKRHNTRYPLGGTDPQVISGGLPLGTFGDGDGWDTSHHAIYRQTDDVTRNFRVIDCELDSWKGEIVAGLGDGTTPIDNKSQWWLSIEKSFLHNTHGDCLSVSGHCMMVDSEIAWGTNGVENGSQVSHTVFRNNYFHDHTHSITPVIDGHSAGAQGQYVITGNLFERCWTNGIFVFRYQTNVLIDDNIFVDCAVGVTVSLLSGNEPYANIFIRRNIFYCNTFTNTSPIALGNSIDTNPALQGVYIEDNRAASTPAAQSSGFAPLVPWSANSQAGTQVEFLRNDMRIAKQREDISSNNGVIIGIDNIYDQQGRFFEVHHANADLSVANNTLVDIPGFVETISDSVGVWFEAFLFVTAPAGGAQVAVVGTNTGGSALRYDVELWAGTTIDAASGVSIVAGTPFGSNAAITKIKITGFWEIFPGNQPAIVKLQFAQNTTNATPSKVLIGSWFKVRNSYPPFY